MSAEDTLKKLEAKGINTDWYYRSKKAQAAQIKKPKQEFEPSKTCSLLTMFMLQNHSAMTVFSDGKPYQEYRKLKENFEKPIYYCSHCKGKFITWEQAMRHIK